MLLRIFNSYMFSATDCVQRANIKQEQILHMNRLFNLDGSKTNDNNKFDSN